MQLNAYLNFDGQCEEAFLMYKEVFGGDFKGRGVLHYSDIPQDGRAPIAEEYRNRVLHVALPIGDQLLMGSDVIPGSKWYFQKGVNNYISISPETREKADRLFHALSEGAQIQMHMADMFWGDYFGSLIDRFGTPWMINFANTRS